MIRRPLHIAALILTFKRPAGLERLLASLARQALPPGSRLDVFVWNNDPGAKAGFAQDKITGSGMITVHEHVSGENLKMRAKRSLEDWCFQTSDAFDAIIHLDDDVVLEPGWISACLEAFDLGYDACGSVEDFQGRRVVSGQTELNLSRAPNGVGQWRWVWEDVEAHFGIRPARFAGHRAMMVQAGLARRARHDPHLRIGGEDLDYSLELERQGGRIAISERAVIRHRSANEEDAPGFRNHDDICQSWLRFYRKWGFVRLNAASEAGVSEAQWLDLFAKAAADDG